MSKSPAIFNGGIRKWDSLKVNGNSFTSTSVVTAPPADLKVHLCRRVPGSGAQALFNAQFAQTPCQSGTTPPLETSNIFSGPIVTKSNSAGDAETCLHQENAANNWAVGFQSTEKNMDLALDYRFIKVDGAAPTLQNVADNKYFYWSENSILWLNSANNGPSGDKLLLLQILTTTYYYGNLYHYNMASPSSISLANTQFVHPWGQGGYLALNTNGSPKYSPSTPFDLQNPVATATHAYIFGLTGSASNCRVPTVNGNSEL